MTDTSYPSAASAEINSASPTLHSIFRPVARVGVGWQQSFARTRNRPLSRIDPYGLTSIEAEIAEAIAAGDVETLGSILEGANPAQADIINAAIQRFGSTADQPISKECQAGVRRVFPKSVLNNTLKEILEMAKAGDREAKTAWKLLNDLRFKK